MHGLSVYLNPTYEEGTLVEQVERAASAGADAIEYRPWHGDELEKIAGACTDHGLDLAYLSGSKTPLTDPGRTAEAIKEGNRSVERAAAVGCPTINLSPGPAQAGLGREAQLENTIEVIEAVAPTAEEAGVTLAIEPLNTAVDHPDAFLSSSYEGYEIIREVGSDHVKLLFDIYHQQITEGNITANLTEHVDLIGHVHVADVPGRHEPGTGELNYENVLTALGEAGYDGYVGCEFTPSPDADPDDCVRRVANMLKPN
ncbi:hydroxypyruvate isomerase family protein [Saliphagus infecundisoli]|uniref:Hydroxypyruvate isomerase family protein n=1 Tax=Saliphagus infecundisoli TaxID=1849069 RepID=A0ABD5QDQ3_9EURY|nr:TIM barrel protein [Saliphagus infecundisoli]